ncbi:Uncharacterised protein [Serratia quinivorans]|nr:Uncharacterised protein [Serratia quinivorans]
MGHVHVSHPAGRLEVVPICSWQIGRRASRYDPFGTLSLITCFVSSLRAPCVILLHPILLINKSPSSFQSPRSRQDLPGNTCFFCHMVYI